jgi:hypothetical protein
LLTRGVVAPDAICAAGRNATGAIAMSALLPRARSSRSGGAIRENSFGFLLWGWLIALASIAYFVLQQYTTFQYYFIPFPVLAAIGIIATIIFLRRKNNKTSFTYPTDFINKMWIVLGLCFILVVFINVSQGRVPFTYTLIIAGIGTLISGWVMKFKPLIIGGVLFLISAIASVYIPDEYKSLLHGIAIIGGYLIPGYALNKSKA